jgi:hypothetical protein
MPPTHVLDVYEGPGVEPGKTSAAIEAVVQPTDRTLTDKDIEALSAKIVPGVARATGAVLRGSGGGRDGDRCSARAGYRVRPQALAVTLRSRP